MEVRDIDDINSEFYIPEDDDVYPTETEISLREAARMERARKEKAC